jgi:hypothetical protein
MPSMRGLWRSLLDGFQHEINGFENFFVGEI